MIKTTGIIMFQNFAALKFLKGFNRGMVHNNIITKPIMHTTRASNLKPMMKAEPENALPGGLNFQKMIRREAPMTIRKINNTEKIQRNSFGIRCKNSMRII